jgi:hypothetical protein
MAAITFNISLGESTDTKNWKDEAYDGWGRHRY